MYVLKYIISGQNNVFICPEKIQENLQSHQECT